MRPYDSKGLNDAQVQHAEYFFLRLADWRESKTLSDEMCIKVARGDAQRRFPLREHERIVMDEYLRECIKVREWSGSHMTLLFGAENLL